MTNGNNFIDLARRYHENLPGRIRRYLYGRGISDDTIETHLLGWNGQRITIPVYNRAGELAFFKLAKDPEDRRPGPKMLASPGSHVELYGWEQVLKHLQEIIICEGEFDRLALESNGFPAVTSTGGAGTFRLEWAEEFTSIERVYVCFDRDGAGRSGARWIGQIIPHAKIVELPEEVGEGGDVSDFFTRLKRSREDVSKLLQEAKPAPPLSKPNQAVPIPIMINRGNVPLGERVERIKRATSIAEIVERYVTLRPSGKNLVGLCPFHEDHHPSLTISPATNTFRCYGCGNRGDVINFLQEIEHLSFSQALNALDRFNSHDGT